MQSIRLALLITTLLHPGCRDGLAPCPPGSVYDSAVLRCVADPGDVGVRDAGVGDLGADAELPDAGVADVGRDDSSAVPDAGAADHGAPDAGAPCGGQCAGAAPICEPLTDSCVECLSNTDCPGAFCDASTARCVECLSNAQCGHLASSWCDPATFTCSACQSAADCAHIRGRPACVAGQCGPCHPTLGDDCGLYSCSQITLECSDNLRGWSDIYEECEASSECTWGPCVQQRLVGPDRHVCTVSRGIDGCGWTFPVSQARPSIHGDLVEVCMLRENWLTYEAAQLWMHYWRDNLASPDIAGYRCDTNSDCAFGTYCRPMHFFDQAENTNHCTITGCTGTPECPSGLVCRPGDPGQPNYCAVWRF